MAFVAGTRLGPYEILSLLGAGGMGEVYRARDSQLDRDVAIKILFASAFYDERARKRFRNEALTLAKLNHPYIASIHEFSAEKGVDYIVMEYVPGESLAQTLSRGTLPERQVVSVSLQIAEALEEAHEQGVVHKAEWFVPANTAVEGLTAEQASWTESFWNRRNLEKSQGEPVGKFTKQRRKLHQLR